MTLRQPVGSHFDYEWRGQVGDDELQDLHAVAFEHQPTAHAWNRQLASHSLGWVIARTDPRLVGFVNVAWDGGSHAFLLDAIVAPDCRHQGVGQELVRRAAEGARTAGCLWLHVDFENGLEGFYLGACGFRPTEAGLIALD